MSEYKGTIKAIGEVINVSDSFKKRELVITSEGDYPQTVMFEVHQDKVSMLDNYSVGDAVELGYNIRGREWTNPYGVVKYFNTLQCWKIDKLIKSEKPKQQEQINEAEQDDLPF